MEFSPPPPSRPAPSPFPARSSSMTKGKKNSTSTSSPAITRASSNASARIRSRSISPKKQLGSFSAPPTWRAKFANANPLRRSKLATATTPNTPTPKRWSAHSSASARSATSTSTAYSNISLASSTVSYVKATVVDILRVGPPKLVDARSPMAKEGEPRKASSGNQKLLEYWGVRQSDREVVARQRAASGGRLSAFVEEFEGMEKGKGRRSAPAGIEGRGDKELPARPMEEGQVSEGLMKWFRCDIFPTNAQDFHVAEAEAKRLVVEDGGTVMEKWTYPGGFMFQILRNRPCPLPPSIPSATPNPATKILSTHLGETGSLRVTEFQPHLHPMEHLLQLNSSQCSSKSSQEDMRNSSELVSAIEYITSTTPPPSTGGSTPTLVDEEVEEIPLLRTTPKKPKAAPAQPGARKQSWQDSMSISPEAKSKLHTWLGKQQGSLQAKKRREGQVYGESGSRQSRRLQALKMIEEVVEEGDIAGEEEGEWVSDHGSVQGSDEGSEFSVATGLDSVRFVAQCGSLF